VSDADLPLDRMLTVTRSAADYPVASLPGFRPAAPGADSAQLSVSYLSDGPAHIRLLQGLAPAAHTPPDSPPQIALSQTTARLLGLRVGQRLTARYTLPTQTTAVTFAVSGIFTRTPGGEDFWRGRRALDVPLEYASTDSAGRQVSAQALLGADGPGRLEAAGVPEPALGWQLHVDLGPAAVRTSAALPAVLHSYLTQVNQLQCSGNDANGNPVCVADDRATTVYQGTDGLTPLLADFEAQDRRARALDSYAEAALAAIALATVVVTGRQLLTRRGPQLRLQRARGAGVGTLMLLRGAAAAVVVTGAGLLGWWVGSVCAPEGTSGRDEPTLAVAVAATAVLLPPVQTWLSVREPRRPADTPSTAGRRIVAEATVLLLAVAAVAALRARGASGGPQGPDPQLTATPVLVSVAVVVVLLRVYPMVLRGLARGTRRGPGLVAFVGLRSAADAAPTTGLALYVLVLTLGTAVFGDVVTAGAGTGGAQGLVGVVSGSYAVCTWVGAVFCLLALALELVLTARDRGRTVAMLRTLGLGGPPVLALQLLQTLPLAVAAAAGGAVLGLVEPQVLGTTLDPVALTGAGAPRHADHTRVAFLALAAALLVLAVAAAETLTLRRRRLHAVLRLGER
jgi:putative ABC transport system permease protein